MTRRLARAHVLTSTPDRGAIVDRTTRLTRGILFIGDPHVGSRGPQRRRETDWLALTLDKLAQAVGVANARNLQAVCPGDLVNDHREVGQVFQVRLIRVLRALERRLALTVGNHDKQGTQLAENEVLTLLEAAGIVDLVSESGPWGRLTLTHEDGRTHRVLLGMTAYGFAAPTSLAQVLGLPEGTAPEDAKAFAEVETVLWITHADYAFEGAYPGAAPLVEIPGVDLVINGHMHGVKKPVIMGSTVWYCPGNIVRWSVDQAEHVPAVWAWDPFAEADMPSVSGVRVPRLEAIALRHTPGAQAFSFEGRHGEDSLLDEDALAPAALSPETSRFVDGLAAAQMDLRQPQEGGGVRQELTTLFEDLKVTSATQSVLERLVDHALAQMGEGA